MKRGNQMKLSIIVVLAAVALVVQGCGLSDFDITKSKIENDKFYHTETDAAHEADEISEEALLDNEVRTMLVNMTL